VSAAPDSPLDRPPSTMRRFVVVAVGADCSWQAKVTDLHLLNNSTTLAAQQESTHSLSK